MSTAFVNSESVRIAAHTALREKASSVTQRLRGHGEQSIPVHTAVLFTSGQQDREYRGDIMNEEQASAIAEALGGESWQSGGDIWMVVIKRKDGKIIGITDEVVCVYDDEEALENSEPQQSIVLH